MTQAELMAAQLAAIAAGDARTAVMCCIAAGQDPGYVAGQIQGLDPALAEELRAMSRSEARAPAARRRRTSAGPTGTPTGPAGAAPSPCCAGSRPRWSPPMGSTTSSRSCTR